ncbi:unnamed protein product, partial [Haemonchus placei]|uniref:Rho-GAP domain-containing protein n=1 Tax=Haemonchus placei TaxID=6290 RepID=A0A0N4X1R5_HAEPC
AISLVQDVPPRHAVGQLLPLPHDVCALVRAVFAVHRQLIVFSTELLYDRHVVHIVDSRPMLCQVQIRSRCSDGRC